MIGRLFPRFRVREEATPRGEIFRCRKYTPGVFGASREGPSFDKLETLDSSW
jgi:hypothetical protein